MKQYKKILSVILLLSMLFALFLPTIVHAEESYTLSGTWQFDENITSSASFIDSYLNFTSHTCSSGYNISYSSTYHTIRYMDDELGNVLVYDSSGWKSLKYRTVNFGEVPQEVEKDFYLWFTSVAKKVEVKPSAVIDDLNKDSKFNVNNYPHIADNYGLEIIQIAESNNGELYIYVYQPSDATKDFEAKYINMSVQDISTRNLTYDLYSLTLVNSYGVFDKYVVNNFTVKNDVYRYYNIASIYREYDKTVDVSSEAIDTKQYKSYPVGQYWCAYYYNDVLTYEMEKINVVNIDVQATGSVRYFDGFKFYWDSCDSHYIAFSVSNYNIDKIYDADITYTITNYNYWYNNLGAESTKVLSTETITKKLTEFDTAGNSGGGLLGKKYTWNRIQDINTFIKEAEKDANEAFSTQEKNALNNAQFVFRFAETDYATVSTGTEVNTQYSVVTNIGILRLHFLSEGKAYNLGCVSDLVGTDSNPELDVDGKDNLKNYLEEMDAYLEDFFKVMFLIILVIIILIFIIYFKPVISLMFCGVTEIFSLIYSTITLPFQLIASAFKNNRRQVYMDFLTLFFTTALVFIIQKFLQFIWDKIIPENKKRKRGSRYGK